MFETNHSAKPFIGVRFVLSGFDLPNEQKVRSKLVEGGGVDAGQYSKNCTHVIVDNIVYDDPLCVTARRDCKTLVTGLWVDHSFDIGMPVDATSIMYRPLRDLNGIPGAKGLIMCLTGYQRQDRDDIMTMVGLMGAQFSKPLVATKVTHLICYKFEGEKYDLAKKLPKVKLVNHRWLEDCSYAMEMMEAEAKDSEEEAEDTSVKQMEGNMHRSPILKSGYLEPRKSPKLVVETSNILPESALSKDPYIDNTKSRVSGPSIENKSDQASSFNEFPFSKALDYRDAGGVEATTYNKMPDPHCRTPISKNATNDLTSSSWIAERPPHSEGKFSAVSYQRKTPRRLGELSRNGFALDNEPMGKLESDDLSSSLSKAEHSKDRIGSDSVAALPKNIYLQFGEKPTGFSPWKRALAGSFPSPNLQKNDDARPCIRRSPSPSDKILEAQATSFYDGLPETNVIRSALSNMYSVNDCADVNSALDSRCTDVITRSPIFTKPSPRELPFSRAMLSEFKQQDNGNENTSISPRRLKISSSSVSEFSEFDVGNSTHAAAGMREPQNQQPDGKGSSASKRDSMTNSNGPSSSSFVGNDNSATKLLRKTMVAKKTLGSGPKLGSTANKKGSIYSGKKSVQQNDAPVCLSGENNEKYAHAMKPELCSTIVSNDGPRNEETIAANKPEDIAVHRTGSLDDETETPEENIEQVLEDATFKKESVAPFELIGKSDILRENESTGLHHLFNDASASTHAVAPEEGRGGNASENAVDGSISAMAEPSSKVDGLTRKRQKGKTGAVGKSMTKKVDDAKEVMKSKELVEEANASEDAVDGNISAMAETSSKGEGLERKRQKGKTGAVGQSKMKKAEDVKEVIKSKERVEETNDIDGIKEVENEKRAVTCPVAKSKHRNVSKKKLQKSAEEEKENKPIDLGTENRSEAKRFAEKQAVSPNVEQTSAKFGANSSRQVVGVTNKALPEPACFILSGHRLQRKEFQKVIRRLNGRFCRDSHQWSYQATHFIAPCPIRRTEKFFAAAASGRWILKTDYLAASNSAGKFIGEEPYEWYKNGLSEDGAINLEAPRKWRLLRERTGHGAFHGMRVIVYGECMAPPLDTLKRVVKAGDGTILATSPPYTRFLDSGVDFAIVVPGMPRVDVWVQEFLKHEIPCVVADYLVEYVCKPGYSLEKHVLYNSHAWADKSLVRLQARAEEVVTDLIPPEDHGSDDVSCKVCGCRDRGEVMLICGDESGSTGCGVGCHIDCCDPPFEDIPEDDWFCSECSDRRSKSSETPSKRRKKGTSSVKCK
ncbi:BRCT domain-containing protein [Morus notabilis]|uniref:BRCT domain-containing protein n=1 Tax=Morus notabilis TaxID=981085 RepID=W9QYJ6_9ROSA|nr:BRCT domain-containing protein [Morus notabilis]